MGPAVTQKYARGVWFEGADRPAAGAVWPGGAQELLLRAALSQGAEAAEAWRRWTEDVDPAEIDPASAQLLPLVYRNLVDQGIEDDRLASLKPRYAVTWARNQRNFRLLGGILERLGAAGIETVVFKGAALIPLYYRDAGVRGMGDVDVMVRPAEFPSALRALGQAGWKSLSWRPEVFDSRFQHALALYDEVGNSVDLHCHLLMACCEPGADQPFWEASRPFEVEGAPTRTLCTTDHLLQACVHGLNWVRVPPLRWVADAITMLRVAHDEVDWDRAHRLALERDMALPVREALGYLHRVFDAPVPADTLGRLGLIPVSFSDRLRFGVWMKSSRGRPLALLLHHWTMFSRGLGRAGAVERARGLHAYLRFWANTDRIWKIPAVLATKGVRVIGHRLGLYRYWDA